MVDKDQDAKSGHKPCHVRGYTFGPNGECHSVPVDPGTQERWEAIRYLILAKEAELATRRPKPEPVTAKSWIVLRGEPDLFDLDAWKARLAELRADPPSDYRDGLIDDAEAHIRAIGGNPVKSPADGS